MSKTLIPEVLPAAMTPATRQAARHARSQVRAEKRRQDLDLVKQLLADPLVLGLGAMVLNEAAYRSGFYEPPAGEKNQSVLGGPVWFQIGPDLPAAQAKRNFINTFIIGVTTAKAMAPAMPGILAAGGSVAKALAAAA